MLWPLIRAALLEEVLVRSDSWFCVAKNPKCYSSNIICYYSHQKSVWRWWEPFTLVDKSQVKWCTVVKTSNATDLIYLHRIYSFKMNGYTFNGCSSVFSFASLKVLYRVKSLRQEFAPFIVDTFSEGLWHQLKQTGIQMLFPFVKLAEKHGVPTLRLRQKHLT